MHLSTFVLRKADLCVDQDSTDFASVGRNFEFTFTHNSDGSDVDVLSHASDDGDTEVDGSDTFQFKATLHSSDDDEYMGNSSESDNDDDDHTALDTVPTSKTTTHTLPPSLPTSHPTPTTETSSVDRFQGYSN